jgi:4-alpha-glucanotransferase
MHSTQDTSTLRGLFNGWYWQTLKKLGLVTEAEVQNNLAQDKQSLMPQVQRLKAEGLLDKSVSDKAHVDSILNGVNQDNQPAYKTFTEAMHGFLAKTKSKLAAFLFEDVIGQQEQVNIPGVADGSKIVTEPASRKYPSWRKRLALDMDTLLEHPWLKAVSDAFQKERPAVKTN